MSRFHGVFNSLRVLLVVVHVRSHEQGFRNALVAFENGADGVFLISHGYLGCDDLSLLATALKVGWPDRWVGLNYLDLPDSHEAVQRAIRTEVDGIWVDNAGIVEGQQAQTYAHEVYADLLASGSHTLLFGGVAFKGQRAVDDVSAVAALAAPYMDIVTTSGKGTGIAADPEKLRLMAAGAGGVPLGLASGVSAANVRQYLPYATCLLVSSSLTGSELDELSAPKVRELAELIHRWSPQAC